MANAQTPQDGQAGPEQTPEYNEALRQQLQRDLVSYEKVGNQAQMDAINARLTELGEPAATAATAGYADMTKEDLYAEVQRRGIEGMSQANKDTLIATLEADDRGEVPTVEEG